VFWYISESEVLIDREKPVTEREKPVTEKEEVELPEILVWLTGSATRVSMIVVVFHLVSCLRSCFTVLLGRYIRKLFRSFVRSFVAMVTLRWCSDAPKVFEV
jgi:hypothetical protein